MDIKMEFFMFRCIAGFCNIFKMTFMFFLTLILTLLTENPMAHAESRFSFDDVVKSKRGGSQTIFQP
jgi:hypothetical protein